MNFISQNSETINTLINACVLLVWLIYAQLLYLNFSRQRRPKILINQVQGYDLDSICIVSNMSMEPVHIECILLVINSADHSVTFNVTERPRDSDNLTSGNVSKLTRQGPLATADYIFIGQFRSLLENIVFNDGQFPKIDNMADFAEKVQNIEIRALADYGPGRHAVGSMKRFVLEQNEREEIVLYPETFQTHQVTGWRARAFVIPKWFDACTNKYIA